MSRLSRVWKGFFLNGSVLRTYVETLLVFLVLMLLTIAIYESDAGDMTMTSLVFFINPCSALYYSLRLRIPRGGWIRRFIVDALWMAVPVVAFNMAVWAIARTILFEMFGYGNNPQAVDFLFLFLLAFPYVFFRVSIRFIAWWNELRQRRVIWSLVSSNLLAVALLQAIVILPFALLLVFSTTIGSPATLPSTPLAQSLYRVQVMLPMVGVAILMGTIILIALLPVSIAVSYFFARRIRRRLDALLDAAHAARDGDYDAQVVVSGSDEIARLQTDFNAMTANLKINVDNLRGEREKVAALLSTRRELMANVSHELRTPIATVRAYLDSSLRQHGETGDVTISQNDLAVIQRETLRLQGLIDDLFALSRAEVDQLSLNLAPINAVGLIQRVVQTTTPMAWRVNRIEVVAHVPAWLPPVIADESRLEQVLHNLIHNGLRHTPPGGLLIISAREANGAAEIQVQDTGEGIQPEHLPHIWERYYRDEANGGTGLGLTLVKSFMEAMHGQVSVSSIPGEGACFTLTLPTAPATASDASAALPQPEPILRTPLAKTRAPQS